MPLALYTIKDSSISGIFVIFAILTIGVVGMVLDLPFARLQKALSYVE